MPCLEATPLPPLPSLPGGVSIPVFPGLTLPSLGLCCKIRLPAFPIPAIAIGVAFPAVIVTTVNQYVAKVQALYDMLAVPCPNLPDPKLPKPPIPT